MTAITSVLDSQPTKQKRRGFKIKFDREFFTVLAWRVGALGVFFGLWQVFAGGPTTLLPTDALGRPSGIFIKFWELVGNGQLFSALGTTGLAVVISVIISVPLGSLLALLTNSRFGRWAFQPLITVSYAIPKVGLIALFILLFGIKTKVHVALVVVVILFPFFFGVRQGLEELDTDKLAAFRLMGAGRMKIWRSFTFRSVIPQMFAAARIALPLAFAFEIFAELKVPAATGLGVLLLKFTSLPDADAAMSVLFFVMFIGYLIDVVVGGWLRKYADSIGAGVQI